MAAGRWAGGGLGGVAGVYQGRGRSAAEEGLGRRGRSPGRRGGQSGKRTAGRVQGFQLPQEQGRSRRLRSTCRGSYDGHGLALRHGLPLTESVLHAAAAARQTAGPFQSIPATCMRCRPQRGCGAAHTACCVHMWCLIAWPFGRCWVCVWRGAGGRGGGGGASCHTLRGGNFDPFT